MRVWLRPLREHERNAAAEICWQGFEPKLGRVLCPATKGVEFLRRALQPDAGLAAVDATDRLLGVAGIKTIDSGFVYAGALLRQIYGRSGAFWRAAVLETFDRPALPGQLLIDGLCVERDHRGRGIGSCLIGGVLEIARQRGFATVRLEVTNGNLRAQALYARHGFVATDSTAIGWAAPLVGFGKYTTMIRKV